jgi:aldehyde dehydrogenase (NAD+)
VTMASEVRSVLARLGLAQDLYTNGSLETRSPITGERIALVRETRTDEAHSKLVTAGDAFRRWRVVPAPRRGELVRLLAEELRAEKQALGKIVTIEVGKTVPDALGEVQEMIDICDFAVGLSRQLYGVTMPSERSDHRIMEQWHPLGIVGVISAFNFPVAVWCWNAALALICGNSIVWKPSEKTPLSALAVESLLIRAINRFGTDAPAGLMTVLIGDRKLGELLVNDVRVPLISATGSTRMGRVVGERVATRFGRTILELGGNNASIVTPSADLELALRAVAFGAMGTAGQRCTSLRRLIVHESVYAGFLRKLISVYENIAVGNPMTTTALVGPLIDKTAFEAMQRALATACDAGGSVYGGERIDVNGPDSYYVRPALVALPGPTACTLEETFAPILYVLKYKTLDEAIELQNGVPQGLSSSIFATDMRDVERFLSPAGSDCGIANINMGPSGAEIGGAFGGEKETGGGRESGSDAWKGYMRRQTSSVNYGHSLPLAQGVTFDIGQ